MIAKFLAHKNNHCQFSKKLKRFVAENNIKNINKLYIDLES
jgi:hypothetical protein